MMPPAIFQKGALHAEYDLCDLTAVRTSGSRHGVRSHVHRMLALLAKLQSERHALRGFVRTAGVCGFAQRRWSWKA